MNTVNQPFTLTFSSINYTRGVFYAPVTDVSDSILSHLQQPYFIVL